MKLRNFASITHQGPYLQINEDGMDYDIENNLYMIFDGLGGSGIGDACISFLKENMKSFYLRIADDKDATMPFFYNANYLLEANSLINAMIHSHRLLFRKNMSSDMEKRAAASGIFVVLSENIATIASVGNCVSYLFRKGKLDKLTIENGHKYLTTDNYSPEFKTHPLNAFGLFADLHYQLNEIRPAKDDILFLATDGAYSRLTENEIAYILNKQDTDMNKIIEEIFELSNSRGNKDNQTAMILKF